MHELEKKINELKSELNAAWEKLSIDEKLKEISQLLKIVLCF